MARKMEFKIVDVDELVPNPFQPREGFDKESISELADSLKSRGEIQPIIVRKHKRGYQIICGERRWRAAKLARMGKIPVLVRDTVEEDVLLESLVENLHRLDLTDIERENAIYSLWKSGKFKTRVELARAIGVPESRVQEDVEAKEFREKEKVAMAVSTRVIRGTRGLPTPERKHIIEKVQRGELKVSEVDTTAKILRSAPEPIKRAILKPKSRITPVLAEKLQVLPVEKQSEAIKQIESLRLTEDEGIAHIETMKVEVPLPPPEELEKIRERYESLQKEIKAKLETPEAKERGELFRNWSSHIAIAGVLDSVFCPICKSKQLGWICHGLSVKEALEEAEKKYKATMKSG